ncbi:MAG: hypothetical protein JXR48_01585 [Candidatus Delongbacteria bacterium]|nr:hypothetical protein [Candidatus Delongbacteria bacterium]MBN2833635.1 hypothetical protein [Candidatus Delongbacteria bacterium]
MENEQNKNQHGYDLYNEIIENWGYAYQDEQTGEVYYHPTSYAEVQIALDNVKKIEELAIDDEELISLTENVKSIAQEATQRKFIGSKWIIILAGIAVLFLSWMNLDGFSRKIGGYYSAENAAEVYSKEVKQIEDRILYYTKNDGTRTTNVYKGSEESRQKYYEMNKDELDELKKMSPEDYISDVNWSKRGDAIKSLFGVLFILAIYGSYFYAARAPIFLINRRKREIEIMRKSTGWLMKFVVGFVSLFWSIPTTTTVTKWSDGSTTRESDALPLFAIQITVTVVVAFFLIYLASILLPFLVIVSYIRNYQFERLDRYIYLVKKKLGLKTKKYTKPVFKNEKPRTSTIQHPLLDEIVEGSSYYVKYSEDNYYYFAKIDSIIDNSAKVTFFDGYEDTVLPDSICFVEDAISGMKAEGNWENKGAYYPCKILKQEGSQFFVRYDEDGIEESIGFHQLRFK